MLINNYASCVFGLLLIVCTYVGLLLLCFGGWLDSITSTASVAYVVNIVPLSDICSCGKKHECPKMLGCVELHKCVIV